MTAAIDAQPERAFESPEQALAEFSTSEGAAIAEHSRRAPVLLVFLRHLGCTFCRQALADLAKQRTSIERAGSQIILVHMSEPEKATRFFSEYNLADLPHVSDPSQSLYRAMRLPRGSLLQLFGPKVFLKGLRAFLFGGHRVGRPEGDGFQLPGVFLIENGKVVREFRHKDAADRPEYADLAVCPLAGN